MTRPRHRGAATTPGRWHGGGTQDDLGSVLAAEWASMAEQTARAAVDGRPGCSARFVSLLGAGGKPLAVAVLVIGEDESGVVLEATDRALEGVAARRGATYEAVAAHEVTGPGECRDLLDGDDLAGLHPALARAAAGPARGDS